MADAPTLAFSCLNGNLLRTQQLMCPRSLFLRVALVAWILVVVPMARAQIVITEFMAANTTNIVDEDLAFSDWIEVHNT